MTPVPTLYDYSSPRYDQKHVFDLSVTYDLDLWRKILKIILHNEDSTSNMYVCEVSEQSDQNCGV